MPEFAVELIDPNDVLAKETLSVRLNKVPKRGSWFDIGGGVPAKVTEVRIIGGEPVIFAVRDKEPGQPRLKPRKDAGRKPTDPDDPRDSRLEISERHLDLYSELLERPRPLTANEARMMVELVDAWRVHEQRKHIALMGALQRLKESSVT